MRTNRTTGKTDNFNAVFFQVGMLTLKSSLPEVNFQDKNDISLDKLLTHVQQYLPPDGSDDSATTEKPEETKDAAVADISYQVSILPSYM